MSGSDLLSVSRLIATADQADDGCVISKLDDGVEAVGGYTVIREHGVQKRTEHAALRAAGVEGQGGVILFLSAKHYINILTKHLLELEPVVP